MVSRGEGTAAGGGGAYRVTLEPTVGATDVAAVAVSSMRTVVDAALTAVATFAFPRPVVSRSYSSTIWSPRRTTSLKLPSGASPSTPRTSTASEPSGVELSSATTR